MALKLLQSALVWKQNAARLWVCVLLMHKNQYIWCQQWEQWESLFSPEYIDPSKQFLTCFERKYVMLVRMGKIKWGIRKRPKNLQLLLRPWSPRAPSGRTVLLPFCQKRQMTTSCWLAVERRLQLPRQIVTLDFTTLLIKYFGTETMWEQLESRHLSERNRPAPEAGSRKQF